MAANVKSIHILLMTLLECNYFNIYVINHLNKSLKCVNSPTLLPSSTKYVFRDVQKTERLKLCTKCDMKPLGDEHCYIFLCAFFKVERDKWIYRNFTMKPSTYNMSELLNSKGNDLYSLCRFILTIHSNVPGIQQYLL
jgi:hypothetical protein